jgi:hypothetical protein
MARAKGIIAYGTDLDREMVAALASVSEQSVSEWIVAKIRASYRESFQNTDPKLITLHQKL